MLQQSESVNARLAALNRKRKAFGVFIFAKEKRDEDAAQTGKNIANATINHGTTVSTGGTIARNRATTTLPAGAGGRAFCKHGNQEFCKARPYEQYRAQVVAPFDGKVVFAARSRVTGKS